jgi:hypothetical protein
MRPEKNGRQNRMKIRELQFDDFQAVQDIRRRNGLGSLKRDFWNHLLRDNPFLSPESPIPHGWILENDAGSAVGTFGNFPAHYEWNGRTLVVGVAHTWAVDAEYRRYSLGLLQSYHKQSHVHFLLHTSANSEAAHIQKVVKTNPIPVPYFGDILLWVLSYREFVAGVLRYKKAPAIAAAKYPLAAGLWGWDRFRRLGRSLKPDFRAAMLNGFDERFDVFWEKLRQTPGKLRAVRTREALEWHFYIALSDKRLKAFIIERPEGIVAYLLLLRADLPQTGWHRYRIADLQTLYPEPGLVESLLASALDYAREQKAHVLEAVGLDAFPRETLEHLRPLRRSMTVWPAWYRVARPVEGLDFENPEVWDFSLFDGDATIWADSSQTT